MTLENEETALAGAALSNTHDKDSQKQHNSQAYAEFNSPDEVGYGKDFNLLSGDANNWPKPLSLLVRTSPELYPLDALPKALQDAVREVQDFTQAPIALVASSSLAALSVATQAIADVKRAEQLTGAAGLFILVIADSGERKSTCDGYFIKPIQDYEREQAEAAKPLLREYHAAMEAWEAKRGGVKDKIRLLAKQ